MTDSLIVQVIHRYHPGWNPPVENGYDWVSCLCPFHDDSNRSASVSYNRNAFHCFACPAKGDAIALLRQMEGMNFESAKRIAEEVSPGSYQPLSPKLPGKSRRRAFGETRPGVGIDTGQAEQVPVGVRGRSAPWT